MVSDIAVSVVAAAIWIVTGYKALHLRRHGAGDPGRRALQALVVILALLAGTFTLTPQATGRFIDATFGVHGLTRLLANLQSMATCLAIIALLLFLSRSPEEARQRFHYHARVTAVMVLVVGVLFVFDHPAVTEQRDFAGVYNYVYFGYIAFAVASLMRISRRYADTSDEPLLRFGLHLVVVASTLGMAFIVIEVVYLLDGDLRLGLPGSSRLAVPFYSVSAVLFVIGLSLPSWGRRFRLDQLGWRLWRRRSARRLHRLWELTTTAVPEVVLDSAVVDASPVAAHLRLARVPVEICDAWLSLRHWLTPAEADRIRDMTGRWGEAATTAAIISVAVQRKRAGVDPADPATPAVEDLDPRGTRVTLVSSVRYLCEVSRLLTAPCVRRAVAALNGSDVRQPASI